MLSSSMRQRPALHPTLTSDLPASVLRLCRGLGAVVASTVVEPVASPDGWLTRQLEHTTSNKDDGLVASMAERFTPWRTTEEWQQTETATTV